MEEHLKNRPSKKVFHGAQIASLRNQAIDKIKSKLLPDDKIIKIILIGSSIKDSFGEYEPPGFRGSLFSDFDFIVYVENDYKIPKWLKREPDGKPFPDDAMNLAYRNKKLINDKYDFEVFFLRRTNFEDPDIQKQGELAGIPMTDNTAHKYLLVHKQKIKAIGVSGPPGIGKSTIGKLVAKELNIPFYDLDDLIAKKAGVKTTKEIINKDGLPKFKQIQHACLKEVFQNSNQKFVLAFGGHTTYPGCNSELIAKNKILVKDHLFNICLIPSEDMNETVDILWPRQNDGKRETGTETSDQYRQYIQNLIPQYIEMADKVVFTRNASVDELVTTVMNDVVRA